MKLCAILFLLLSSSAWAASVQPVPIPEDSSFSPQVQIEGLGIATLGVHKSQDALPARSRLEFEDSSLFIGASERLYDDAIGSFGLGGVTTRDASGNDTLFLNRAFVDYQSEKWELFLGRSDISNHHLIDFPTLRDDDLLNFTHPLNPLSGSQQELDQRYSDSASLTLNQNLTHFESLHVQHLRDPLNSDTSLNSFGANYEYLAPPGLEKFQRISSLAVGYDRTILNTASTSGLNQITAGMVVNLNESATDLVDLRFQEVLGFGSNLTMFSADTDVSEANAHQEALALRYLHEPFGMPAYQLALTLGYKDYFKIDNARAYSAALTGVKQLGHGFDLVAQYQGIKRGTELARVQTGGLAYEQIFEAGLVFHFSLTLNAHLSPRRTLLNQQHQYIPQ